MLGDLLNGQIVSVSTYRPPFKSCFIYQCDQLKSTCHMSFGQKTFFIIFQNLSLGVKTNHFLFITGKLGESRRRACYALGFSIAGIVTTIILMIIALPFLVLKCGENHLGIWGCYTCERCSNWDSYYHSHLPELQGSGDPWEGLHCLWRECPMKR